MARVLVAIANHGNGNLEYLEQLLSAYSQSSYDCDIVILSDKPKTFGSDIEVLVGAPERNPWSLPFVHRSLFKERLSSYDYFIYSEDDTLIRDHNINFFSDAVEILPPDEIAGFMRTETTPDGQVTYSTCHSFFRWIPSSVRVRGNELWAIYSNEHSASFVATRDQISRAYASGGFPLKAHEGRHDMLCSAATDIYASCGLNRVVCIDRIDDFSLPHLSNKYTHKMGMPAQEMQWQIEALRRIHRGELSRKELFDPETRLPRARASKNFHLAPDLTLETMLGEVPKRVLVWGAGDGVLEASLRDKGHDVTVVPFNAVFGFSCEKRGLKVFELENEAHHPEPIFDCVVTVDCLHLCADPVTLLGNVYDWLLPGGEVFARIPNLNSIGSQKQRWKKWSGYRRWDHNQIGAHALTTKSLRKLTAAAGFEKCAIELDSPERWRKINSSSIAFVQEALADFIYISAKKI